jgi:hypothetical protein
VANGTDSGPKALPGFFPLLFFSLSGHGQATIAVACSLFARACPPGERGLRKSRLVRRYHGLHRP